MRSLALLGLVASVGSVISPIGAAALAAAQKPPKILTIVVADLKFGPTPPGLQMGDVVQWVNKDIFRHSATAIDGSFDRNLPPHGKARAVMKRAGLIAYYCRYHPGMKGQLKISP